jgi:hypothetical protein
MLLARRSPWMPLAAAVTVAAAFLALLAARPGDRASRALPPAPAAALPVSLTLPRVCMTRYGMCPVGPVQNGRPCGCPHPLRGSVPGHVELLGGTSVRAGSRDWPSRETEEAEDPLADLDPPLGP